jgi:oxygen-dependent protoporphyrinogen oxidase
MRDVIVIGGGVSGLATAHNLMRQGLDVHLLERQVRTGGNAISQRFQGFLMEHGPTTFNASVPVAVQHLSDLDLLADARDLGVGVKRRYLLDAGKLSGISTHPLGFFRSDYLSIKGRLSMLLEALRPRKKGAEEETIHAFASRRFGREFADKVIDPMAAGLFMGDSRQLSISGAFGRLAEMEQEFGSITRAVLAAKRGSEPGRHLYSWQGGMATVPARLAVALGGRIKTGVTVLGLQKTAQGFAVKTTQGTRQARAVVVAAQPHVAAGLLEKIDPEGAAALQEIMAPPISVIFFGYRREQVAHPLDGLGFLTTKSNNRIISGAQFGSTMYAGRAPDGHVAISVYAGGMRNPDLVKLPDADLIAQVQQELSQILGISGVPVVTRLRRWQLGLPQYSLGHEKRRAILGATHERAGGLFLAGNYLDGVSMASCLDCADRVAAKAGAFSIQASCAKVSDFQRLA